MPNKNVSERITTTSSSTPTSVFYFVPIPLNLPHLQFRGSRKEDFEAKRQTEDATTVEEAVITSRKRRETMRTNFLELYQVDIDNFEQFDLVLDTTEMSPEEVFVKLTKAIDSTETV